MELSQYAKEESIGDPSLFCGREKDLNDLLDWVELIPKKQAKSRALMATKKMGKTAILDRLYNILFQRGLEIKPEQSLVIPFFFQVGETKISMRDFGRMFYFSFLTQYVAFKCREPKWTNKSLSFLELVEVAEEFQFEEILKDLKYYEWIAKEEGGSLIWEHASGAPHRIASQTGEFVLQIIDEFQYLNKFIFVNELLTTQIDLAGTYHKWSESRIAPQLISGSWVGWLREILREQLSPRYTQVELFPFPDREALECVYNYAELFNTNLSEESALAIQALSRNHPWYISTLIRSIYSKKDLSTVKGVDELLQHEVNYKKGEIYLHWMEYIGSAFARTNGKHARAMVLLLSSERHQEKSRSEIQDYLKQKELFLEDEELDKRLKLLCRSDIIEEGSTAFHYKGIPDDLFNQVVQVLYAHEIENIKLEETYAKIQEENKTKRSTVEAKLFQQHKGYFLELMMGRYLKYQAKKKNSPPLRELIQNASDSAKFFPYQTVAERHYNLSNGYHSQFDIVAKAVKEDHPSLLIECKYHEKPIGSSEVENFARKVNDLKQEIPNLIPILYSVSGFTKPAIEKMKDLQLSWSTPEFWEVLAPKKKKPVKQ